MVDPGCYHSWPAPLPCLGTMISGGASTLLTVLLSPCPSGSSQPSVIPDKDQVLVVAVVVVVVWSLTGSHQPQEITRLFRGGSNNEDILTGATSKGSGPASSSTTDTCSHPSSLCYHKSLCSKMMNWSNNAGS